MTYPSEPARGGMPSWAKWTLIGCGGCLVVAVLGMVLLGVGVYQFFGKNFKTFDVSAKPDPPLTATANQLFPTRVGSFVRKKVGRVTQTSGGAGAASGWQGSYVSGGKRVELVVTSTAAAQAQRAQRSPFGSAMQQQRQNPGTGVHMSFKMGGQTFDMVVWSKPNWTFVVQSPDMVAKQFATAYRPAVGGSK